MYRILDNLEWESGRALTAGVVDKLEGMTDRLKKILLKRGLISEVQAPPLKVLPGWESRAEMLEPVGIETVDDLLEANLVEVSEALGVSEEALEGTVEEARSWVEPS